MIPEADSPKSDRLFLTTQWSIVLAARDHDSPDAHTALTQLCSTYWHPLYCCVRRHGHPPAAAQDFTQAFFAKLLEKNQIAFANPERGRFRTFLLRSLENFLHNEHERATAAKRGGRCEVISWDAQTAEKNYAAQPAGDLSPGQLFERRWATTLLSSTLARLRQEFSSSSRVDLFDLLEPHLWADDTRTPYAQIGGDLKMTEVAVKVTMHRLRQRYRDCLRDEIAQTVATDAEVDDELRHLRRVLAR